MQWLTRFSGIVLAGGASTRMGVPKAFLGLGPQPRPLISVGREALVDAGAPEVLSIGGDLDRLRGLGFDARSDEFPGEGPFGGLVTGLHLAGWSIAVVLSCDLPAIDAATVRGLVSALDADPAADAAVPIVDGHRQVLAAAYRTNCEPRLRALFEAGERSVRRALGSLRVALVTHFDPAVFVDLDVPGDVDQYARRIGSADAAGPDRPGA